MRLAPVASCLLTLFFVSAVAGTAGAQLDTSRAELPALPPCDGMRVTGIDVKPGRPPFEGSATRWRNMARAIGLHHATTRPGVVDAFLALEVGDVCTERRRLESERILRAQTFIAEATVRAIPDGAGRVRLSVQTTDEVAALANGRFRGINPQYISLGNGNIGGLGLRAEGSVERGYYYRTGYGLKVSEYATFGRPYVSTFEGQLGNLGHLVSVELAHPFYTDFQHHTWHLGYRDAEDYLRVDRPARDPLALRMTSRRWDASTLLRAFGTNTVTLFGIGASGLNLRPDSIGILVTDSGLKADTGITLRNRYQPFRTARLGALAGLRRVTFSTVHGFDGLTAAQDVASGFMTGLFVGKGVPAGGESDVFLSGAAYGGLAGERSLLAGLAQVEGRKGAGADRWDSMIGSARIAYYLGEAPGLVFMTEDKFSGGKQSLLPIQLALDDRQGGIMGYHNAALAGALRNVVHSEVRWSRAALVRNADVGIATFGEVGSVWRGDAPYGVTASRASVGISILAAYPTKSKRIYRADFGFPITRQGEGSGKLELRLSSEDRTILFWREPDDVSRARTGAVPTSMFAWPTQ